MTPAKMIARALRQRPELREVQYRLRINDQEAEAALLELLPSLQSYAGLNYDSNSFLYNKHWLSWGNAGRTSPVAMVTRKSG